jgi:hypothetical protein
MSARVKIRLVLVALGVVAALVALAHQSSVLCWLVRAKFRVLGERPSLPEGGGGR